MNGSNTRPEDDDVLPECDLTLLFPEGLYPELTLIGFGEAFRASLAAAGARNLRVELVELTPGRASWALAWQ